MPAADSMSPMPADPREPVARDLERKVAFEAIRGQLFAGRRQPVAIGRFTITQRVGHGGMGTVYAAFDPQLERKVAIKVVRDLGGTPEEIERARRSLEREARAAAGLRHPNVVTVYDSGRWGDGFYVAMEFVEGRTLRSWLAAQSRPWPEIVGMFAAAGRGLQAAHAAGLVHCDVKPDNVLVGPDGRPQVADFGLVRWVESREPSIDLAGGSTSEDASGTVQTTIAGTPRFMAPEQRRGLPVSPRCDQFSFCVALYEALFAAPAYRREDDADFDDPGVLGRAHVGSAVPRRIVRALLVGLALAPESRHATMGVLVDELERALVSRRRRPWWWLGAGLVVTAGGLGYALAGEPTDPCEAAGHELASVWSAPVREQVYAKISTFDGTPFADRVAEAVDRDVAAWSTMRRESCEATLQRGTQSTALFELRTACLDRRRHTFENLVGRLHAGEPRVLAQADVLLAGISPVEECAADFVRTNTMTNATASRNDLSRSPEADAASQDAYRRLDDAKLELAVGDRDVAMARLQEVEGDAHDAGLRQVEGLAIRLQVDQRLLAGSPRGALARLRTALGLAIEAGDHGNAVRIVVSMLRAQHEGAEEPIDAPLLLALGRAWAERSVRPLELRAELELEAVSQVLANGSAADALVLLDELQARLDAAGDTDLASAHRVRVQMLRASTLLAIGQLDGAEAVAATLVDRLIDDLGPRHPMVADVLLTRSSIQRQRGDLVAARAYGREAHAIYLERLGPDSPRVALVTGELAGVSKDLGDFAAARVEFEQSLTLTRRLYGDRHGELAVPLNQLAELEYEMGERDAGLAHAREAVAIATTSFGEHHVYTAAFESTVGKLELSRGNALEAREILARAHATMLEDPQIDPAWIGEVAFFLAQATLAHEPTMRAEAGALADRAVHDLGRSAGAAASRFLPQINAWKAAHGLPATHLQIP